MNGWNVEVKVWENLSATPRKYIYMEVEEKL